MPNIVDKSRHFGLCTAQTYCELHYNEYVAIRSIDAVADSFDSVATLWQVWFFFLD